MNGSPLRSIAYTFVISFSKIKSKTTPVLWTDAFLCHSDAIPIQLWPFQEHKNLYFSFVINDFMNIIYLAILKCFFFIIQIITYQIEISFFEICSVIRCLIHSFYLRLTSAHW